MHKYLRAAVLAVAVALIGAGLKNAFAYNDNVATKYNDVQVDDLKLNTGNVVDSNGATRITVGANNTVTGSLTPSGPLTVPSSSTLIGVQVNPSQTFATIFGTNTIPAVTVYENLMSTGSNLLLISVPSIATTTLTSANFRTSLPKTVSGISAIPDGTYVELGSTATIKYFIQDNSLLSGSAFLAGFGCTTTEVITSTRPMTVRFDGANGMWVQKSPCNGSW